jgi:general stress protein 26
MTSSQTTTTSLLTAALFVVPVAAFIFRNEQTRRQKTRDKESLRAHCDASSIDPLRPPFPPAVQTLLQKCRLAYLSTVDADTSHLSLMRFTYLASEEVIIMSTNQHTKKYDMLKKQRGVAVLVHDFGGGDNSMGGEYSITLNGTCSIIQDNVTVERYRKAHLKHNPDYPQFIVGEDIAILCVDVRSARICNIADQVIQWNVADAGQPKKSE